MTTQPPAPSTQLDNYLAHFQWRVLQDALIQATADHWEHRASALEEARPRRGDYPGKLPADATNRDRALAKAALRTKHRELTLIAQRCRSHAALLRETGLDSAARHAIVQALTEGLVA